MEWDKTKPTQEFLITDFYVWLMQDVIDYKLKELSHQKRRESISIQNTQLSTIDWIENNSNSNCRLSQACGESYHNSISCSL